MKMQRSFAEKAGITACSAHRRISALQSPTSYKDFMPEQAQWVRPFTVAGVWLTAISTKEVGVRVLAERAGHESLHTA